MLTRTTLQDQNFWGLVLLVSFVCGFTFFGCRFLYDRSGLATEPAGISMSDTHSRQPALAFDELNNIYIVWQEGFYDKHIFLKRWDGVSWQALGNSGSGSGLSQFEQSANPSVATSPGGIPFVAWSEGYPGEIYIKYWNGEKWLPVSPESASGRGISQDSAHSDFPYITFEFGGQLSVVWRSIEGDDPINTQTFDGQNWQVLDLNASIVSAYLEHTASGYEGTWPAVIELGHERYSITKSYSTPFNVARLDGTDWLDITPEIGDGADNPVIAVDNKNLVYLAWEDETYGGFDLEGGIFSDILLLVWNGNEWQEIGSCSASVRKSCQ